MDSTQNNSNTTQTNVQVIQHNHTVMPFEWAIQKLFEPILGDIGQDMVSVKRKIGNVVVAAVKKLKPGQEEMKTNTRVAWNVMTEAAFTGQVGAEYFGGILAASKSETGEDDTPIYYLQIAKSLSSKQLYLHYIIYKSLNSLFLKDSSSKDLNVGMGSQLQQKSIYFFGTELAELGVNINTDFQALEANNLIAASWEVNQITINHPIIQRESTLYQAKVIPTTLGIQLLAISDNKLDEYRKFTTQKFGDIENVSVPQFFAFSSEDLLRKSMESNTHEIVINKPISDVFQFTTDPSNTPKWIDGMKEEKVDALPIKLGTKYSNTSDGEKWDEYTCVQFVPNSTFELSDKDDLYHVNYSYEKIDVNTTKLTYHEWIQNGVKCLDNPFEKKHLEKLKQIIEA